MTQLSDLFEQLKSQNLSKLDKIKLRKILTKNSIYLKDILSLDTEKYHPYISSL